MCESRRMKEVLVLVVLGLAVVPEAEAGLIHQNVVEVPQLIHQSGRAIPDHVPVLARDPALKVMCEVK